MPSPTRPPTTSRTPPTQAELDQLRDAMQDDAAYLARLQSEYGHPFLDTAAWWANEDTDAA